MIITRTPFRVTLGGGGTDLPSYYSEHGGFIFAAALDKYMFINLNPPIVDDLIRIRYTKSEEVEHVDELQHELAREALKLHGITRSIEIISMADIPAGTGLGSSSCYLVGLLNALHTYTREYVTVHSLAEEACHIELEILKKPIGKQDQYMAAFGGLTVLDIQKNGEVKVRAAKIASDIIAELESNTMIYYTGISRSATQILAHQDNAMKEKKSKEHMVVADSLHRIKETGYKTLEAFETGNLHKFGELMHEHWTYKRAMSSRISNDNIDRLYEIARDNGAVGGKLLGAGGGGFLMLYCDKNKVNLDRAMKEQGLRRLHYRFDFEGSKVLINLFNPRGAINVPDGGVNNGNRV